MYEELSTKPQLPPPSPGLFSKIQTSIKQHKTLTLFLAFSILFAIGTTTTFLVAPAKNVPQQKLFAPATESVSPIPIPTKNPTTPTVVASPSATNTPTISSPTPTRDPLAWITYPNTVYGYTIQYPSDWSVINLGKLEPKVPNYVVFNPSTATPGARSVTISVSNRTYEEQVGINGGTGTSIIVGGIQGTVQNLRDSNGRQSIVVTLPRAKDLLLFYADATYTIIFYQMLDTIKITN